MVRYRFLWKLYALLALAFGAGLVSLYAVRSSAFSTVDAGSFNLLLVMLLGVLFAVGGCFYFTSRLIVPTGQDRAQFRAILAAMVEGIIAVDGLNRVLFCNGAASKMLNTKLMPTGRTLRDLPGFDRFEHIVENARANRTLVESEISVGTGEQTQILEVHANAFRGNNSQGVVVVLHDVSALRRLETVRRDFVANVSHELKTPLTSIKGYVETLASGALYDQDNNQRFLKKIDDNVNRLVALVQDLLSLARIESQDGGLRLVAVDWLPIVNSVLSRREVDLQHKELSSSIDIPAMPVIVRGDREAMTQVLDNLVDNAIKYTPQKGKIAVRIRIDETKAELDVEDTGIGIPEDELDRVFERFYRVDKARSRQVGGTGLGLSIVKHLVSGMHGSINVTSRVGQGTKFMVAMTLSHGDAVLKY